MSDHEFENYLTLIGRLLRLSSAQRKAIGEELRDHFESRLTELVERGMSHTEAVRVALEEFGDAAGLAAQFTTVSQTRKRRLIMRCTVGSAAAIAAVLVIAMAAWPERQAGLMIEQAKAQTEGKQKEEKTVPQDPAAAETEKKLDERIDATFQDSPLTDVAALLHDSCGVQFFFDETVLTDAGKDSASLRITSNLSGIRVRTFLQLNLGAQGLGYRIKDGIVVISTKEDLETQLVLRIYDCRKILVAPGVMPPASKLATPERATDSRPDEAPAPVSKEATLTKPSYFHLAQIVRGDAASKPAKPITAAEKLISVLKGTIATATWDDLGGPGTIAEYGGLLVISQTQQVHEEIADFLEKLEAKLAAPLPK